MRLSLIFFHFQTFADYFPSSSHFCHFDRLIQIKLFQSFNLTKKNKRFCQEKTTATTTELT